MERFLLEKLPPCMVFLRKKHETRFMEMLVFSLYLLANPHFSIHMKKRSSSTFKVTGYGYSRQECVDIATDFAVILGKR